MTGGVGRGIGYSLRLARPALFRGVAIGIATCVWVLACAASVVVVSAYQGRAERTATRSAVPATASAAATFLWGAAPGNTGTADTYLFYVRPLSPDAPLPPGVVAWPQPGEAVVSPRLAELLSQRSNWTTYSPGKIIGLVDSGVLATDRELLAYINPPADAPLADGVMIPAQAFGGPPGSGFGSDSVTFAVGFFYLLDFFLGVIPAGLLLVSSWLIGHGRRHEQHRRLELLGANRRQQAQLLALPALLASLSGAIAATAGLASLCLVDLTVPGTGYTLRAHDLRPDAGWLLGVCVLATSAAVALLLVRPPRPSRRTSAQLTTPSRLQWSASVACVACLVFAIPVAKVMGPLAWVPLYLPDSIFLIALAIVICTLPSLTSLIVHHLCQLIRRGQDVSTLVSAGLLRGSRRHVTIFAGGLACLLSVLLVVDGYARLLNAPEPTAVRAYSATIGHVVKVRPTSQSRLLTVDQLQLLAADVDRMVVAVDDIDATTTLYADPHSLRGTGDSQQCSYADDTPDALRIALAELAVQGCPRSLAAMPADGGAGMTVILYRASGDLDPSAVAATVAQWSVLPADVTVPGAVWIVGTQTRVYQGRWLPWFGAIGLLLSVAAVWLLAAADVRQAMRRVAGYLILGASAALPWKVMTIRVAVPTLVALACAGIFSVEIGSYFYRAGGPTFTRLPVFGIYAIAVLTVTAAVIIFSAVGAYRVVRSWRPGQERE